MIPKLLLKKYKGTLVVFAFLLFGIILALYLAGYQSPFLSFVTTRLQEEGANFSFQDVGEIFNGFINAIVQSFTDNPVGFGIVGIIIGGIAIASLISGGYGAIFIISLFLIMIFANIFILPISFIFEEASWGNAEVLKMILATFLNLLLIMSIITFSTGRE